MFAFEKGAFDFVLRHLFQKNLGTLVMCAGLFFISPALQADDWHLNQEISTHFRGLDSNAGGIQGFGIRYRYRMIEFFVSQISGVGIALREDLNEMGTFVPHVMIGIARTDAVSLMAGTGLNIRMFKFWGANWGLRADTYAAIAFPNRFVYPVYTLGVGVAF